MNNIEKGIILTALALVAVLALRRKKYDDNAVDNAGKSNLDAAPERINRAIDKLKNGSVKVNHQAAL